MFKNHNSKTKALIAAGIFSLGLFPDLAHANGSGIPWEGMLQQILASITGPVALVLGTLAIVSTGFAMAFSEGGSVMKKAFMVLFGLSVAFGASSFFMTFFGYAGGAVF